MLELTHLLPPFLPLLFNSWKSAAQDYLQLGGRLLQQLQSSSGALLSEQALSQVADARDALEKADAAYNAALDKLEVRKYHSSATRFVAYF
jgi:hypothetical protein